MTPSWNIEAKREPGPMYCTYLHDGSTDIVVIRFGDAQRVVNSLGRSRLGNLPIVDPVIQSNLEQTL